MRQLLPTPLDNVDPLDVYRDLPTATGRPGLRLNMIASLDGATAVDGVSGALGGPADLRVFRTLRSLADVILVAAGTARAETYGAVRLPEKLVQARLDRRQSAVPRLAVVSRSLGLDWDSPLFSEPAQATIVVTVASAPAGELRRAADAGEVLVAGDADVDMTLALEGLGRLGVASVLAEGGPTLNGQLAAANVLDELCLTLAPYLASGDSKRILAGRALGVPARVRVASLLEDEGVLFLRARPEA